MPTLPQIAKEQMKDTLNQVDARMDEITAERATIAERDAALLAEQREIRTTRAQLCKVLVVPFTPKARAEKTKPAAEPQKTTEPKAAKAKPAEARITDAVKT